MIRSRLFRSALRPLLLALTLACCHALPASAASDSKSSAQKKAAPAKKTTKPTGKSTTASKAKKAPKAGNKPVKKSSASTKSSAENSGSQCRNVKVKTAQGTRTRRVCNGASAAAAAPLASPITANALDKNAADGQPEFKARSAPERAYAVDGTSFFHQGRKFRVQGLDNMPGDVATQRLQMMLDSGAMTLEPVSVDDAGVTTAVVRVGGQNVADRLRTH